ncbi:MULTISPECIES: cbb3-type cytochrome c oxidase subunit 3 [unclassified Mesorhizobium]|jgi:cytochrome c oxidase cbb3-type subunit 4|uniref:cbb3-type cytochrome c oxidase subunit 3 n=1 Tax=unclassified Mesorhizobium TaxID=325217 RepID=UPI00086B5221|nr:MULTISPECIES: cbb3-type cytochrome c oxidase subunit 3 [unclassified Mesorhizobium]MBN9257468.1 cbb3-type cytochrome c oxidase subunit 3 [Mesorhizobium sp.]ODT12520.1 MAG: nitrogen fixation protein FixQ [Mesorhizobium sp. SCN 65-12]OJX87535.1 MAG: cbb3-type cytochrome C oxidase subunit 3 [Mesorhizobium sp. 65-26]
MDIGHETLVAISKSWGLFYLLAFSVGVMVYAFWPGNRKAFEHARTSILAEDDTPLEPEN